MATRFSKVTFPRVSGNRLQGDVLTQLKGLDMISPWDEMDPGRTPDAHDFRLYQTTTAGKQAPVSTRKGPGFYITPLGENADASNTSSTGASTAQVGLLPNIYAQSFTAVATERLTRIDLHVANGTANTVLRIDVHEDDGGKPGKRITRSSFEGVPDVATWVTARFLNSPELTSGETYWFTVYVQDDGAGQMDLTTTTAGTVSHSSNGGIIALTPNTFSLLYRVYTAPEAKVLGQYRFNKEDGLNRTLVAIGTTIYIVDETNQVLAPLISGLSANATEYSFTNGDGKVFWANGYDDLMAWNGTFEADNPNIVNNGTFEVNASGWVATGGGTGAAVARTTTAGQFRTGVAGLAVTATSGLRVARYTTPLDKGRKYRVTAWVKGATAASNAYLYAVGPNATIGTPITLTTDWQKIETYYVPTTSGTTAIDIRSDANNFYLDDVQIVDTGFEVIIDPDLPKLKEITFHKDRLWGVTMADKNKIVFSENPGNPTNVPTSDQWYHAWLSVSFVYVPRPFNGSPITSMTSFQDNLIVTTQDCKYVLSGSDRGNLFLRESSGSKGALSRRGVIADPNYIFFVGSDGIYRFNGSKDEKLSFIIQPLFDACPRKHEITLALWHTQVRAYMSSAFALENDIMALFEQDFNEWCLDTDTYIDQALYYSDADDNMELVEISSQTGTLFLAEQDFDSLGAPIDFDYRLKYDSKGMPGQRKKYKRFVPLVQAVGRSFPITYGMDKDFEDIPREKQQDLNVGGAKVGEFFVGDGTIVSGSTAYKPKRTSVSGYSNYLQFRVRREAVKNQVSFMGVQYTYKAKKL